MDSQTIRTALGTLQAIPDSNEAWTALRDAAKASGGDLSTDELLRLLDAARDKHESRGEWSAVFKRSFSEFLADDCMGLAQQIAYSSVQRSSISLDPRWRGGDYYDAAPGDGPHQGLAVARELAQITYRTEQAFDTKFGRTELDRTDDAFTPWQRFDVEG